MKRVIKDDQDQQSMGIKQMLTKEVDKFFHFRGRNTVTKTLRGV